jgi:hypothetical protein
MNDNERDDVGMDVRRGVLGDVHVDRSIAIALNWPANSRT